ncbi:MAG TPA: MFS transporter [Terracidiphilus sp.]|nr:MFS transporter [Terracidiphilus sp.]
MNPASSSVSSSDRAALRAFAPTLILLVFAVLINYVDRGSLALAAPLLKVQWGTTASQLGILLSAFFWTYTALQFVMGIFVERLGANRLMALGFLVWSIAMAFSGAAVGFATLLALRLLLGVGESVMFPASSKIMAQHLPEHARGFANGLMNAAMRWGTAIGTFGGGLLMARYGWRPVFVAIGIVSLLWLPAWSRWKAPMTIAESHVGISAPTFAAILRKRTFWGAASGHFCANYLVYFLMSWLPYYLVNERHLSMAAMSVAAGALWAVDSLSSIITGMVTDLLIRRSTSAGAARKWAMAIGFTLAAVSLIACAFAGERSYLWWLIACAIGCGTANAGTFAFAQTLAGPRAAGKWVGLQNGIANMAGVTGPALSGFLVDWTGHFAAAFTVAALITLGGAFAWCLGVPKLEPVNWNVAEVGPNVLTESEGPADI